MKETALAAELSFGEGSFSKEGGNLQKLHQVIVSRSLTFPEAPTGIKPPGLFR